LARRKEIGIMRLVGASSLYITVPFVLEQLFAAAVGVGLAAGALALTTKFVILEQVSSQVEFLPWVGWADFGFAVSVIAVLGPLLTLLPTLLLTRKYSKV
jgi:cell division transport system permease protein